MQKTLAFLEQNVQWLALAIAAVFFGLCVWWYVVTPPAQIVSPKLSKEPLTPQNVDDAIHAGPVQDIKRQLEGPQQELAINVPDVVKPWQKQMNAENARALALDYPRPIFPPGQIVGSTDPTHPLPKETVLKDMPKLPKAAPQTPQSGMSVVSNPAPAQGGGGAQAVAATNYDKEWATVSGVIPANDVKAAFLKIQNELNQKLQAQGMPNIQLTTDILKIELQRQRGSMGPNGPLFPNGENGVETVPLPQYLQNIVQPLPDAKAGLAEKVNYYDWAEKNAELVSQPKFYDIHGGTPWVAPTLAGAAPAGAANAPAPPPNAPKPLAGIPPVLPPRVVAPAQPNPALGAAGAGGNKNQGAIAPENLNQDILVWAHDDTVQPGAVYRYRIIYYMKNPVMGQKNIADQSIIDTLAVKSPPSDWSAPVTIPQVTEFWFARAANNGAAADIYHWENGGWTRKQNVPINPGDRVADSEWTVIDVHGGNREREKYVILTNDNGEVVRRFPNSDRTSDRKKALDAQVNPAPAAAAGPGGGTAPQPAPPPRTPSVAPGQRAGVLPRGGG